MFKAKSVTRTIIAFVILVSMLSFAGAGEFELIPVPRQIERAECEFVLSKETTIIAGGKAREAARHLQSMIAEECDLTMSIADAKTGPSFINLAVDESLELDESGYVLEVAPEGVTVRARDCGGLFYGAVTLGQMVSAGSQEDGTISVPAVRIRDWPRFEWRGLMLDCSRTFQSLDYLRKTIDRMAFYKMNVLHLHLTDDQGWRLEIEKYPELTQKGARFPDKYDEPASHDGFYTQEEMKGLVSYAAERNVTIVPEIEMPGHSLAALACYPELSCTGGSFEIFPFFKGPNITRDIYCAGNEETFAFLKDVLDEVIAIFPSEYIHIGGDEAPKARWEECPKCQERIAEEGLQNEHELQSYFIERIEEYVNSKGRKIIGWDEILEGGLAPNAAVMSWRGIKGGIAAAKAGNKVVMSPTSHCYFDYSYAATDTAEAYSFEPVPASLASEQKDMIMGLQANFWSHIDREPEKVDRQLFPRLLAIAERGWSDESIRDTEDFLGRVKLNLPMLEKFGINYRVPMVTIGKWRPETVSQEYGPLTFDISKHIDSAGIYKVQLQYTRGACRLGMRSVELLCNSKVAARDDHRGEAGARHIDNTYELELDEYDSEADYELRITARSEGGGESYGNVYLFAN
ncbi:Beta-hexosaminidase [Anaerohalosphaera lusitana]|uniref:beta-N-acetylhexosaminidase n=1 Tax=Anaerohalosphaera lusitana TaxID=1936003 RepID=A0A1U9NJK0_9BACT|nr:beta-N-acetylhexosaminidase [Anaerohalosphaera lusitana]AQT67995.1 Beta-hexosaminidase [Anaerohalosphaera lusitana]